MLHQKSHLSEGLRDHGVRQASLPLAPLLRNRSVIFGLNLTDCRLIWGRNTLLCTEIIQIQDSLMWAPREKYTTMRWREGKGWKRSSLKELRGCFLSHIGFFFFLLKAWHTRILQQHKWWDCSSCPTKTKRTSRVLLLRCCEILTLLTTFWITICFPMFNEKSEPKSPEMKQVLQLS